MKKLLLHQHEKTPESSYLEQKVSYRTDYITRFLHEKNLQMTNTRDGVEKREHSYCW